jgi:hypothetical protein
MGQATLAKLSLSVYQNETLKLVFEVVKGGRN